MTPKRYTIGLDLGMGAEPTALAVLERRRGQPDDPPDLRRPVYSLRHLHRYPPGTGYPMVVASLTDVFRAGPMPGAWLLVDYTAVGRVVLRMILDGLKGNVMGECTEIALTNGFEVVRVSGGWLVPKTHLIGTVLMLLQTRRLQIARELPDAALLVRELDNYRPKVSLGPADAISWRDSPHDDLLLATALAAWGGERSLASECSRERRTAWKS